MYLCILKLTQIENLFMKNYLVVLWLASSLTAGAQELTFPSEWMNQNPELSHSFTVVSKTNKDVASDVARRMEQILSDKKLEINYMPNIDTALVDVVFHLDGDRMTCRTHSVADRETTGVARKGAQLLEKMFYSGMRPSYSTVFKGDDGVYPEYRIPSVVVLPSGRIVAFIEARNWHRDQAENDIVARYSDDMGKTWSRQIVVNEQGASSLNNPCAVYIAELNQILLMYQVFPPKMTEGSSFTGSNQVKVVTVTSNDGGETWTAPVDISSQTTYPGVKTMCCGPGVGIRTTTGPDKGRIVIPFNANGNGGWFNYVAYSDDLGKSWKTTQKHSGYGANESQIVQTGPSEYLINARSHRFIDPDTQTTPSGWNPWDFSRVARNRVNTRLMLNGETEQWGTTQVQTNLPDPNCQGSIMRLSGLGVGRKKEKSRILLANPASQYTVMENRPYQNTPARRVNGTVRMSYDEGKTWAYSKRIYGNRFTEYQYSVLVNLGDGKIGCFFEAYPEVRFAVFDRTWLTGGED